jgi:DNA repair protein RadC
MDGTCAGLMRSKRNSAPIPLWPRDDRPREKLIRKGVHTLSDVELMALILRTGSGEQTAIDLARTLFARDRSLRRIGTRTPGELMRLRGIGPAKAVELLAAFELGRRAQAEQEEARPLLRSPDDVAKRMIPLLRDRKTEVFYVLILDAKNALTIDIELSVGTLNASLVHPREVFKAAIDNSAASIIVVHNHPSGNPEPSTEDIEITRQLAEAGRIIGIPLHDHLIVAGEFYTSHAERGLL